MSHVSVKVRVTSTAAVQRITTGGGLQRDVQQLKVDDESGSITLVLWDDKIEPLKPGDLLQIKNGYVTSFKGDWRINIGKSGEMTKVETAK